MKFLPSGNEIVKHTILALIAAGAAWYVSGKLKAWAEKKRISM